MGNLITSNIVGSTADFSWSQAQTFKGAMGVELLVVVYLKTQESDSILDLADVGAAILVEFEKNIHLSLHPNDLKKIVEGVKSGISESIETQMIVAMVKEDRLALCGEGMAEAYLVRDGKMALLSKQLSASTVVEGVLEDEDRILLASSRLVESIGVSKLKNILCDESAPDEAIAPLIHKVDDSSGIAAIFGEFIVEKTVKPSLWQRLVKRERDISLRSEEPRKLNMWVGAIIFVLLILMIGVGTVQRARVRTESEYQNLETSINTKLSEIISIGELNPDRARVLLVQSKSELESYLSSDVRDEYKDRARKLVVAVELADDKAFKKSESKLDTVVELSILADGLKAEKMKSDGKGNLIFLDSSQARLVAMNLIDRSRQVVEFSQREKLVDIVGADTKNYGLNADGVFEVLWKNDQLKKVIEPDEFWKKPTEIDSFGGNVYILDVEQGEIWKYPNLGETFGTRRRWFGAGIALDLTNVVDMKVVGDIWLLTSTGKLERYSRGVPVKFGMDGFPALGESKKLVDPKAVWVTDSMIYVLESGAKRVVAFDDNGKYQAQYVNSDFEKASDLVVVDNTGYVLVDNVVKEFGL